jgi:cation diffusion facilitator CzcD-associated flavoprotein CzcO
VRILLLLIGFIPFSIVEGLDRSVSVLVVGGGPAGLVSAIVVAKIRISKFNDNSNYTVF